MNTHCLLAQVVDRAFGTDCTFVLQNLPVCVVDPNSAYVPDLLSFGQLGRFTPSYLPVGINIHYSLELTLRTRTGARPDTGPLLRKAYLCPCVAGWPAALFQDPLQLGAAPGRFSSREREAFPGCRQTM